MRKQCCLKHKPANFNAPNIASKAYQDMNHLIYFNNDKKDYYKMFHIEKDRKTLEN